MECRITWIVTFRSCEDVWESGERVGSKVLDLETKGLGFDPKV